MATRDIVVHFQFYHHNTKVVTKVGHDETADEMQKKYPGVKAAMIKAQNADKFESVGEYNHALECYQAAVELLLPLLEGIVFMYFVQLSWFE